jgi:hypothetical protein
MICLPAETDRKIASKIMEKPDIIIPTIHPTGDIIENCKISFSITS